ncbi:MULTISPECIES: LexA regulated protein [Aliagarivorans]|uniref:LexA regulated protein n=1 Tax=Aliagarivorans TaxID=882379 RepID=UPI00047EC0D8|nr:MULTISPECIES: LexA regulated protein [Aliagarivorans]
MAKQSSDRTTIDLFSNEKRVGRPRTNPLSRKDQLRANKRKQIQRDRENGFKRIELKVDSELFEQLNQLATDSGLSRSELIADILTQQVSLLNETP